MRFASAACGEASNRSPGRWRSPLCPPATPPWTGRWPPVAGPGVLWPSWMPLPVMAPPRWPSIRPRPARRPGASWRGSTWPARSTPPVPRATASTWSGCSSSVPPTGPRPWSWPHGWPDPACLTCSSWTWTGRPPRASSGWPPSCPDPTPPPCSSARRPCARLPARWPGFGSVSSVNPGWPSAATSSACARRHR